MPSHPAGPPGRYARDQSVRSDVTRNYGAGADHGPAPYGHPPDDHRCSADRCSSFHRNPERGPVFGLLGAPVGIHGTGIPVVRENGGGSDEDSGLQDRGRIDEHVVLELAVVTHENPDVYERVTTYDAAGSDPASGSQMCVGPDEGPFPDGSTRLYAGRSRDVRGRHARFASVSVHLPSLPHVRLPIGHIHEIEDVVSATASGSMSPRSLVQGFVGPYELSERTHTGSSQLRPSERRALTRIFAVAVVGISAQILT